MGRIDGREVDLRRHPPIGGWEMGDSFVYDRKGGEETACCMLHVA